MAGREVPTPAHIKAHTTGRWAETMFRALSARVADRWQFVSFRGSGKGEWRGVVDVVAIRKNTVQPKQKRLKRGDLFDIVLVQIKGGTARGPTKDDEKRLRLVARIYNARAIVQFQWRRGKSSKFYVLTKRGWAAATGDGLFGRVKVSR
jgi:hypothetical protein